MKTETFDQRRARLNAAQKEIQDADSVKLGAHRASAAKRDRLNKIESDPQHLLLLSDADLEREHRELRELLRAEARAENAHRDSVAKYPRLAEEQAELGRDVEEAACAADRTEHRRLIAVLLDSKLVDVPQRDRELRAFEATVGRRRPGLLKPATFPVGTWYPPENFGSLGRSLWQDTFLYGIALIDPTLVPDELREKVLARIQWDKEHHVSKYSPAF